MELKQVAEKIAAVEGVVAANVWEKHGKARVYIELPKLNGGKAWNGGKAGTVWYENGEIHTREDWAGAATRDNARAIIANIRTALAS